MNDPRRSFKSFHTLPGLLDSWAALPNSNPNALRAMQGGSLYHFYDGLWYDPAGMRTHYLPCERRTRYQLSNSKRKDLFLFYFYLQLMKKAGLNLLVFLSEYSSKYVSIQKKVRIKQLYFTLTSTKHVSFLF